LKYLGKRFVIFIGNYGSSSQFYIGGAIFGRGKANIWEVEQFLRESSEVGERSSEVCASRTNLEWCRANFTRVEWIRREIERLLRGWSEFGERSSEFYAGGAKPKRDRATFTRVEWIPQDIVRNFS